MTAVPQEPNSGVMIESPTLRKKKTKIMTTRRTTEDLIYNSYQNLMAYIDRVDEQAVASGALHRFPLQMLLGRLFELS